MFIDGVYTDDASFQKDAETLSKSLTAIVGHFQKTRAGGDGTQITHVIMASMAFTTGIVIHKLPRRDRRILREFFVQKLDEMLAEHGA